MRIVHLLAALLVVATTTQAEVPLDTTFSGDGKQTAAFDLTATNADLALRVFPAAGGGYTVIGYATTTANNGREIAIARLDSAGNLTGSSHVESLFSSINGVALDSQGRFVVVGTIPANPGPGSDLLVTRLLANGQVDGGFGFFGLTGFSAIAYEEPLAVATTPDDHIVILYREGTDGANWTQGRVIAFSNTGALHSSNYALGDMVETAALAWSGARGAMLAAYGHDDCTVAVHSLSVTVTSSVSISRSQLLAQRLPDTPLGCSNDASATAIQPAASGTAFYVAGYVRDINLPAGGVRMGWQIKVNGSNAFDSGFAGNGGRIDLAPWPYDDLRYFSLALDGAGALLTGGQVGHSSNSAQLFGVQRSSATGVPDTGFGPMGSSFVSTTFAASGGGSSRSFGRGLLVDGGRFLLAGAREWTTSDLDFAIAAWALPSSELFENGFE